MTAVDTSASLRFTETARQLAGEARRYNLTVPGFRCPPRIPGANRTIRWAPGGTCIVSVRVRDRAFGDVIADMVEGVLVANRLTGQTADGWRVALRTALAGFDAQAA
jgi:hypothetical protein